MNDLDREMQRLIEWSDEWTIHIKGCFEHTIDAHAVRVGRRELRISDEPEYAADCDHLAAVLRRWLVERGWCTHLHYMEKTYRFAVSAPDSDPLGAIPVFASTELLAVLRVANDVAEAEGVGR